jgi:hypothetical protein
MSRSRDIGSEDPRHASEGPSNLPERPDESESDAEIEKDPESLPERQARERQPSLQSLERHLYRDRERTYHLRDSEIAALTEIAKFRTLRTDDLTELFYGKDTDRATAELRNLTAQGLLEKRTLHGRHPAQLLTITRSAHRLLDRNSLGRNPTQKLYRGFVKTREARHDTMLFRLYHKAANKIAREGGTNLRVVLDFELKKNLYHDLAAQKARPTRDQADAQREVAEAHGLKVVDGKIPLPDLRLEYETREHEPAHLDLELATRDYRGHHLAEKAKAGFSIYAPREDASRVRGALQDPHLITDILAL